MKQIFSLILAGMLLFTGNGFTARTAMDNSFFAYFTSDETLTCSGDSFTYAIYAEAENTPVSGLDIYIDFQIISSEILTVQSMHAGSEITGADVWQMGDSIRVMWDCLDNGGQTAAGRFLLLEVTFKVSNENSLCSIQPSVFVSEMYYMDIDDNGFEYDFDTDPLLDMLGNIRIIEPDALFYVENSAVKTDYLVGETIDAAGIALRFSYRQKNEQNQNEYISDEIITRSYTIRTNDFSVSPGLQKPIYIDYMGLTVYYHVNVYSPIQINGITIKTNPAKTAYTVNEAFSAAGLSIEVTETDGVNITKRTVAYPASGLTVNSPVMSSAGTKSVTVSYSGCQTSFNITVTNPPPSYPTDITGAARKTTDTHVGKIPIGMSVPELISSLDQKSYIEVYKYGKRITSGTVSTGMELRLMVDGSVKKAKTVYVTGDVNGDSRSDITDLVQINFCILKKSTLFATQMLAANINNDDRVDITDLVAVNFYILKKQGITAN